MAFNRAGIEKAWNSVTSKAAELRQGAAGMIEGAKNSKAGGMVSDSAAAIHGIGLHTLGGAAMGGTINAAAYANDGAFTGADSGASAFLSGAGYGAAAGMGLGMMHAKKYAAYNAAKRTNSKLKQGTMTKATNELPTAAKVRTPIGMREEQLATDARRQRMLEENGAGLQKIGAAKDENARNNAATLAQRAQQAAASMPPVVKKPAFKLTRDGAAHDLAAQVYEKNVKNSSMPSYNERVARQRRLAWNNRTK